MADKDKGKGRGQCVLEWPNIQEAIKSVEAKDAKTKTRGANAGMHVPAAAQLLRETVKRASEISWSILVRTDSLDGSGW